MGKKYSTKGQEQAPYSLRARLIPSPYLFGIQRLTKDQGETCLVLRPQYFVAVNIIMSGHMVRGREGLGESRTGTRQGRADIVMQCVLGL